MKALEQDLLAAHRENDRARLARLYAQAAEQAEDENARGFFLTHAYVFALEAGEPSAPALRTMLIDMRRETPLHGAKSI
ncbi:MAG: hypothetical protein AAGF27_08550 [Pseudomonadota bacterium]